MSRWFIVTFVVACLVCFIQAAPQQAEPTPSPASRIEGAVNDVLSSIQKGIQGIMNDPEVNKLMADGQKFLENAATTIQREAAKIVPPTEKK